MNRERASEAFKAVGRAIGQQATANDNILSMTPLAETHAPRAADPLFNVPKALVKILDRDLKAAGIAKWDERGWTLDVHALRHTFGTVLSKSGVTPCTAQATMRHGTLDLTMNV